MDLNSIVLIEQHEDEGVEWVVSFDGPNPSAEMSVRCYDKGEAVKLMKLLGIMSTCPSPV